MGQLIINDYCFKPIQTANTSKQSQCEENGKKTSKTNHVKIATTKKIRKIREIKP